MKMKMLLILAILALPRVCAIWGQGLSISISMRGYVKYIDERFVSGRFFWKPTLPPLFNTARASVVPAAQAKYNFAPPFFRMKGKR